MEPIYLKLFLYVIIVLSATFHEYAHAFSAYRLGDSTAKNEGRLTLNPFVHLDLMGTVIIPLFLLFYGGIFIGWAKPVPYNPYNLRDQRYGSLKVGIAGPLANFLIALILGMFIRFIPGSPAFLMALSIIVYINILLGLFNLIPIPPLDGSKVFSDLFPRTRYFIERIGIFGILLALPLAFFVLPVLVKFIFWVITGQEFRI